MLDPAVIRPGRLDKHIYVGMPSLTDREAILERAFEELSVEMDNKSDCIKMIMASDKLFSCADLKSLVYNAFLSAVKKSISEGVDDVKMTISDVKNAIKEVSGTVSEVVLKGFEKFEKHEEEKEVGMKMTFG